VLIRKHKSIKSDLGVTVVVPESSEQIAAALFQGALFREKPKDSPQAKVSPYHQLNAFAELRKKVLHAEWENARDREKISRSRFAQHSLSPEAVAAELESVRTAIGRSEDVTRFFHVVMQAAQVPIQVKGKAITINLSNEVPRALRQAMGLDEPFRGRFDLPLEEGEIYLGRTSPVIEGVAGWTLDQALDPVARDARTVAARCGVISTSAVDVRTTLLIVRLRYHLQIAGGAQETMLCEEIVPLACTGPADAPQWLNPEEGEGLLAARPERNLVTTAIDQQLGLLSTALPKVQAALDSVAHERAAAQLAAHERVREAARTKGRATIKPVLPADILGAYVILPRLN